jgi:hypothetical protein
MGNPPDTGYSIIMPNRIYEQYQVGERVEIVFSHLGENEWLPAVVLRPDPPGLWVQTIDGQQWFMTNTYRIRRAKSADTSDPAD